MRVPRGGRRGRRRLRPGDRARGGSLETSIPILIHRVASFSRDPSEGNPSGVVVGAGEMDDARRQRIASLAEAAATAFLEPAGPEAWAVRFFAPGGELAVCGSAAVAAVSVLARLGKLPGLGTTFETKVGPLRAFRDAPRPHVGWIILPAVDRVGSGTPVGSIARALGLGPDDIASAPATVVASAPYRTLLVPLASRDALRRARGGESLAEVCEAQGIQSIHPYTLETDDPLADVAARHFSRCGVEDPVTGSANGALAAHLHAVGRGRPLVTISQGSEVGRPGRVLVVFQDGRPHVGGPTAPLEPREVEL